MTRIEAWPAALAQLLQDYHARVYDPATNNCAQFAVEWVRRATGVTIGIPAVSDEASATATVASLGGLQAAVTAVLGAPLAAVELANRGDVGITDSTVAGEALCVVAGAMVAAPGASGLAYLRRSRLVAAWRV